MLNISAIESNLIPLIWDPLESLLETVRIQAPNDVCIAKIYDNLVHGRTLLVIITDDDKIIALNVLDERTTDTGLKYLMIPITAGTRMNEWLEPFMQIAFQIARERNLTSIRGMSVRPGWIRALKDYKCEPVHTTITMPVPQLKELNNE